ncbi:MAG: thioredoxin family protein [Alphaproteobacteria bacterium]
MALTETPPGELGMLAPDFELKGVDGRVWSRDEIMRSNGLLVAFICNHCPYVKGILDRFADDMANILSLDIGVVAISSNDADTYPADSYDKMIDFAAEGRFGFPYLYDDSQDIAKAYGAVCTPDFFAFDGSGRLVWRGRLDEFGRNPRPDGGKAEMVEAMKQMVETGRAPEDQPASMGCSIKWKSAA